MASPVSSDRLEIPNDPILISLLEHLGLQLPSGEEPVPDRRVLTREACDVAGIPFEFFARFAQLNTTSSLFKKNRARELIASQCQPLPGSNTTEGYSPTDLADRSGAGLRVFMDQAFFGVESRLLPDTQIDRDEAEVLKETLWALNQTSRVDLHYVNVRGDFLEADRVKPMIGKLAENLCWLSPEGLRLGVLSPENRITRHRLFEGTGGRERVKVSTLPIDSPCSYLPTLHRHTTGLFYRLDQIPPPLRFVADSTVMIKTARGHGSGFVVDRNYIVTSRHLLSGLLRGYKPSTFRYPRVEAAIQFSHQGTSKTVKGSFEVLPLPDFMKDDPLNGAYLPSMPIEFPQDNHLFEDVVLDRSSELIRTDLVVLYVPSMPSDIPPIHLSQDLFQYEDKEAEAYRYANGVPIPVKKSKSLSYSWNHVIPLFNFSGEYSSEFIFGFGYPVNPELRVMTGRHLFSFELSPLDEEGLLPVIMRALPGSSGGPIVDQDGNIVGIMTSVLFNLSPDQLEEGLRQQRVDASILGHRMYPIDLVAGAIHWVVEAHRHKRWPTRQAVCEKMKACAPSKLSR